MCGEWPWSGTFLQASPDWDTLLTQLAYLDCGEVLAILNSIAF